MISVFRTNIRMASGVMNYSNIKYNNTVDKDEIVKLQKHAQEWWDQNKGMEALHEMNSLRVPLVRDGLISTGVISKEAQNTSRVLKGMEILDVGCGGGILSEALAQLGANVTGLDAGPELIIIAEEHMKTNPSLAKNLKYIYSTIEDHSEKYAGTYDAVVASEILEHISEKDLFLKSCVGVLKPGGSFFMTTFNKTFLSWIGGIITAEYILNLLPRGTHEWDKFISPHDVQRMLEQYNCNTKVVHGMMYNIVTHKWSWMNSHICNYALHAVKQM